MREILAKGTIGGAYLDMPFTIPALETTFGGFLFVGIMAGLARGVYNYRKEKALRAETDEEDELAEYAEDMGEFLVGKKNSEPDKIRIYKPSKKKKDDTPTNILDMDFSDNRSLVEEFAAIVAGGAELSPDESGDDENWSVEEGEDASEEDEASEESAENKEDNEE